MPGQEYTDSVKTATAKQRPQLQADYRSNGKHSVSQSMALIDLFLRYALGSGSADIVLIQGFSMLERVIRAMIAME